MTRLNGIEVPERLVALMRRKDWVGQRRTPAWLAAFGNPNAGFVDLISIEAAVSESAWLGDPALADLNGAPDAADPPGDLDPTTCFIIGFVDQVDACIAVDARPADGPRLIYECGCERGRGGFHYATAFSNLTDFETFYVAQHGT